MRSFILHRRSNLWESILSWTNEIQHSSIYELFIASIISLILNRSHNLWESILYCTNEIQQSSMHELIIVSMSSFVLHRMCNSWESFLSWTNEIQHSSIQNNMLMLTIMIPRLQSFVLPLVRIIECVGFMNENHYIGTLAISHAWKRFVLFCFVLNYLHLMHERNS